MVMDLLEREKVNIKELVLPSVAEGRVSFDPDKDISEANWRKLIDTLNKSEGGLWFSSAPQFAALASCIKIVAPERFNTISVPEPEKSRQAILSHVKKVKNEMTPDDRWRYVMEDTFSYTTLFPGRHSDIYPHEWEWQEDIGDIYNRWLSDPRECWPIAVIEILSNRQISKSKDGHFGLKEALPLIEKYLEVGRRIGAPYIIAESLASLRILDENKFLGVRISDREFQNMKKELNKQFEGPTSLLLKAPSLALLMLHMSIVAAKEVRIKNRGLELTIGNKSLNPKPLGNFPQTRRF